jgi:hypothetical protein
MLENPVFFTLLEYLLIGLGGLLAVVAVWACWRRWQTVAKREAQMRRLEELDKAFQRYGTNEDDHGQEST